MADKRLAIVTGGARGIGRAIVFALLKQQRRVAAIDIDEERFNELKELVAKEGFADDLIIEKLDITDDFHCFDFVAVNTLFVYNRQLSCQARCILGCGFHIANIRRNYRQMIDFLASEIFIQHQLQ